MSDTLDDIFEDEQEQVTEAVEVAAEPVVEEQAEQPNRDETGKFAPKGEEDGASPVPVEEKKAEFDSAPVIAERRRRQEAEARIQNLEDQLRQKQEPQSPPPNMWDDEKGWQQHFGSQVVSTAVQQATQNSKLDMSEMMVRQANPDFEEVKAQFLDIAKDNPSIAQQALADPHPWNKAYQMAKNHQTMTDLGAVNVADLEAKIEARIRAEQGSKAPQPQAIPRSLADEQSARSSGVAPKLLTIEDILNG